MYYINYQSYQTFEEAIRVYTDLLADRARSGASLILERTKVVKGVEKTVDSLIYTGVNFMYKAAYNDKESPLRRYFDNNESKALNLTALEYYFELTYKNNRTETTTDLERVIDCLKRRRVEIVGVSDKGSGVMVAYYITFMKCVTTFVDTNLIPLFDILQTL